MSFLKALEKADSCYDLEVALCLSLCEVFNTPRSLAVYLLVSNHEWVQLKNLPINSDMVEASASPLFGLKSVQEFRHDRLVSRILSKSNDLPTGIDTSQVAIDEFLRIESINKERSLSGFIPRKNSSWLLNFQYQLASDFFGNRHLNDSSILNEIIKLARPGPGGVAGASPLINSDKLRRNPTVSPGLESFASSIMGEAIDEHVKTRYKVVQDVRVNSVPKTAYTDRIVSSQPFVDMYLQIGIGNYFKNLLKPLGVDISDQKRNQTLSKAAYDQKYATIDLSSASSWFVFDNLHGIVPDLVFQILDLARPKSYKIDNKPEVMYNFCPMGCGYTFAFMTYYFWALVRCTVPKSCYSQCSVYGDDIIVPQKYAHLLVDRLEFLGFEVNRNKSFFEGNFFESCGHEYICGQYTTPFYCRKGSIGRLTLSTPAVQYRVQLANRLRLWSCFGDFNQGCDPKIKAIWDRLTKHVPPNSKPKVPYHFGDAGLIVGPDEHNCEQNQEFLDRGFEGVYFNIRALRRDPVLLEKKDIFTVLFFRLLKGPGGENSVLKDLFPLWGETLYLGIDDALPSFRGEPVINQFGFPRLFWTTSLWPVGLTWRKSLTTI